MSTTSELFTKHFGDTCAVSMFHPNITNFFQELNDLCLEEDRIKKLTSSQPVPSTDEEKQKT